MQIDHVCLNVPNYEETQWYQEKLDATIEHEWTVGVFPDLKLAYLSIWLSHRNYWLYSVTIRNADRD